MNKQILQQLKETVSTWDGVDIESGPGPFGGELIFLRLGRREIGHVHAEGVVHVPFPKDTRESLLESGQAEPHGAGIRSHVETPLFTEADLERSLNVLGMSYERARAAQSRPGREQT